MAAISATSAPAPLQKKRNLDEDDDSSWVMSKKLAPSSTPTPWDPAQALASARHEFGEHGGVNMSIEASATFTVMEPDTMRRMFAGELGPDRDFFIYSRHFNPTVLNLGRQMAAMEGTEAAYCTASGMSAISSVLLQTVGAGGHIVASRCLYGGTHALMAEFLPKACGINTTFVDIDKFEEVAAAIRVGETKMLYVESVSNPTLAVADIPRLSEIARAKGVLLVVDNTFMPMVISPAKLGADVVVHSVSKYISGGADIIADVNMNNISSENESSIQVVGSDNEDTNIEVMNEEENMNDEKEQQEEHSTLATDMENHIIYEVMTFDSEDEAYDQYNKYAIKLGFSIRKDRVYR